MLYLFALMLFLGLIATWVVVIYAAYKGWGPIIRSKRLPITTAPAVVSGKRDEMGYGQTLYTKRLGEEEIPPEPIKPESICWHVSFDCSDGQTKEFSVPEDVCESLVAGDKGELAWQGHLFVRFARFGENRDSDEIYGS